jgi:hypothetical protein
MADVAVISVIASGAVGVLGAAGGFYAQRVTLRNEDAKRVEARRDHLRNVLSQAAATAMGADIPVDRPVRELAAMMDKVVVDMSIEGSRIGVLVGPKASVYVEYMKLQAAVSALEFALRTAPPEVTPEAYGAREHSGLDENLRAAVISLDEVVVGVHDALEMFLTSAAALLASPR